jgi:hypothetical protein
MFCLLWVLCVVRYRPLRQADHSSRGAIPTVVRHCVWSRNLENGETLAQWKAVAPKTNNKLIRTIYIFFVFNQQFEYKVFYKPMCWLAGSLLTCRLTSVMRSPPARRSHKFNHNWLMFSSSDLSRRVAVDLRLRTRGHWDRHQNNMKQINFRFYKLWQRAMSHVATDVSVEPAVPEVMAPTTLHGVTTHQLATQIFPAVHASNTKHEPTPNSLDNFHGKILYPQGCADLTKSTPKVTSKF